MAKSKSKAMGKTRETTAKSLAEARAKRADRTAMLITGVATMAACLTIPFLQGQRDKHACDALCYGSMTSVRSALDLVGKVIVGRLSDTMGRFPALYLGVMASMAGTILFGTIDSLNGLWLAMLPGALFGHTFVIMKAYLSDHARAAGRGSDESAGALGKLGLAGGLGFMLGPTLGGHLVKDYQQAAAVSFCIQIIALLLLQLLPAVRTITAADIAAAAKVAAAKEALAIAAAKAKREAEGRVSQSAEWSVEGKCWIVTDAFVMEEDEEEEEEKEEEKEAEEEKEKEVEEVLEAVPAKAKATQSVAGHTCYPATGKGSEKKEAAALDAADGDASAVSGGEAGGGCGGGVGGFFSFLSKGVCRTAAARVLLLLRFGLSLAFHVFNTSFNVGLKERFNFTPKLHATYYGFAGLVYSISQALLAKPLIKKAKVNPQYLIATCIIGLACGRTITALAPSITVMFAGTATVITFLGVLNTAISATVSQIAASDQVGGFIGTIEGVESFSGIIGPTIGGLVAKTGTMGPLATVCTMYAGLTTLVLMTFKTSVMSQIESLAKDAAKEDEAAAKKEMEAEVEAEAEAEVITTG